MQVLSVKRIFLLLLLFSSAPCQAEKSAHKGYETDHEIFDIPGFGELHIDVPRLWNYNFTKSDNATPPVITFYVLEPERAEIFQLNMSIFWDEGYSRNLASDDYVKDMVQQSGQEVLAYSDETELTLEPLQTRHGNGYFFDLTDSSATKKEYRFLTQGALSVDNVLIVFALFSNDETGVLRQAMFRSLESARHDARKDV